MGSPLYGTVNRKDLVDRKGKVNTLCHFILWDCKVNTLLSSPSKKASPKGCHWQSPSGKANESISSFGPFGTAVPSGLAFLLAVPFRHYSQSEYEKPMMLEVNDKVISAAQAQSSAFP